MFGLVYCLIRVTQHLEQIPLRLYVQGNKSRKVGGPNEDEDAEEQEYSEEEGSEDDEEIKVPSKRRGVPTREQRMNTRPKSVCGHAPSAFFIACTFVPRS